MWSKERQRSITRLTDDLVKSRKKGAMLLKTLFQYGYKLLFAEPLVLNVLNTSSNSFSMFLHLTPLAGDIYLVLLGSCIIITSSSILSNSAENSSPSEDFKKEYTWSCSMAFAVRGIPLLLKYNLHHSTGLTTAG